MLPPLTLFRSDTGEVATATVPHFASFVDCDCCGVAWVGNYKPSNWPTVKRLAKDIVLCHECAAEHEKLVSMALEHLFTNREQLNVGVEWGLTGLVRRRTLAGEWKAPDAER